MKKYWTHILNLGFLGYIITLTKIIADGAKNNNSVMPIEFFPAALIIEMGLVIAIFYEIIFFMVKAAKCEDLKNKGLCIAGIYLFNIFYIPCFALTHIHKDSNAKAKNIVYVLVSIGMFIVFYYFVFQAILTK